MDKLSNDELVKHLGNIPVTEDWAAILLQEAAKRLRTNWLTIEEFLAEPIVGLCWVVKNGTIFHVYWSNGSFRWTDGARAIFINDITHVLHINKPGLPE